MPTTRRHRRFTLSRLPAAAVRAAPLAVALLLPLAGPAWSQEGSSKDENIREIVRLTGGAALADQMIAMAVQQLVPLLAQANPGQEAAVTTILQEEFGAVMETRGQEFEDITAEVYANHFSEEEIAGLLEFYRSPLGQRLIEKLPAVMAESTAAGQSWGQEVAMEAIGRVEQRLRAEGLQVP